MPNQLPYELCLQLCHRFEALFLYSTLRLVNKLIRRAALAALKQMVGDLLADGLAVRVGEIAYELNSKPFINGGWSGVGGRLTRMVKLLHSDTADIGTLRWKFENDTQRNHKYTHPTPEDKVFFSLSGELLVKRRDSSRIVTPSAQFSQTRRKALYWSCSATLSESTSRDQQKSHSLPCEARFFDRHNGTKSTLRQRFEGMADLALLEEWPIVDLVRYAAKTLHVDKLVAAIGDELTLQNYGRLIAVVRPSQAWHILDRGNFTHADKISLLKCIIGHIDGNTYAVIHHLLSKVWMQPEKLPKI
ncbi:hypothetical protein HDU93_005558 [Gonapodya sp. JEL0774]|nr:hypothetical protein HDU93_005558 [Gonapodya sp. JEL0774]